MASTRGMNKVVSDMDEHGKLKAEIKVVIKESMDALASKDDKVISASIKKKCDEKFGPIWNCIVGEDFKAAFAHESKHYIFVVMGKTNIMVWKL
jgi:dynein light chain LC8-type